MKHHYQVSLYFYVVYSGIIIIIIKVIGNGEPKTKREKKPLLNKCNDFISMHTEDNYNL